VIPTEFAWIVPIAIPFIIGLIIGFIIRHTIKLLFLIIALAITLATFGYISITFQDIYDKALLFLPAILGIKNVLPYSTTTFLLGLALGIWQG
jgi:uncharacterized membrane protein (Fun14 family)